MKDCEEINDTQKTQSKSVNGLIDILYQVHIENANQQYIAKLIGRPSTSVMPISSFVFEFFIFNSLYQVDWKTSFDRAELIYHSDEYTEGQQQKAFLAFLKEKIGQDPTRLYYALLPLSFMPDISGDWTTVTPDARISIEYGKRFFKYVNELQRLVLTNSNPSEIPTSNRVFDPISECIRFIYNVRNNIFHGSKTILEANEEKQRKRIEVYDILLKCITSAFFLCVDKEPVASNFVQIPVPNRILPTGPDILLDTNAIWNALTSGNIKQEDARLLSEFTKYYPPPASYPPEKSALFYPSAGIDFITPIILGLPYCRDFYFFEHNLHLCNSVPRINHPLRQIGCYFIGNEWNKLNDEHVIEFDFNGIRRTVHWVHKDNLTFLESDTNISFYFHRGDSEGEGGSGQRWDSVLLEKLKSKIAPGHNCLYITDGIPGGLIADFVKKSKMLRFHALRGQHKQIRIYYCGILTIS